MRLTDLSLVRSSDALMKDLLMICQLIKFAILLIASEKFVFAFGIKIYLYLINNFPLQSPKLKNEKF